MNKHHILLISTLLVLSACSSGEPKVENPSPTPEPTPVSKQQVEDNASSKEFTEKSIPTTPSSSGKVSGLIPSTNPQERLQQISQGKGDPFSSIRPPAVVKKVASDQKPSEPGSDATVKKLADQDQVARVTGPSRENQKDQDVVSGESPQPTDAEQIFVSGILDLPGETVALITTPWDDATYSVRVGDIISDSSGKINVRVKEISFPDTDQSIFANLNNSLGTVVLEQYGQLVTRKVAQQAESEPTEKL